MTRQQQADQLGISIRTLQRRIRAGTMQEREPQQGDRDPVPVEELQTERTRTLDGLTPEQLDEWSTEGLQEGVKKWCLPADPAGVPTSAPHEHSSTMPSPASYALLTRANAILLMRSFGASPAPMTQRPGQAFSTGMLGPADSPFSYRPATGYGLSQQDLEAESLTLRLHPQFARNRYCR